MKNQSFKLTHDKSINPWTTFNITRCLAKEDHDALDAHINPDIMAQVFGNRASDFEPGELEYEKGYTSASWYFKGPDDVIIGIGFKSGMPRVRGKNIKKSYATPQELCNAFVQQVLTLIEDSA